MAENEIKKEMIESSAMIGGASFISVLLSLLKIKVLALLLGPSGVGIVALFGSILTLTTTVFGLGLHSSGVRQISDANSQSNALSFARARKSLWLANIILGLIGGTFIYFFKNPLSELVFNDITKAAEVGFVAVGVFLSMVAASQTALLQGLRRVRNLAVVKIVAALFSTTLGLLAVYLFGEEGLVFFVICVPLGTVVSAWYFCRKIEHKEVTVRLEDIFNEWGHLAKLGFAVMLAAIMVQGSQLFVRLLISDQYGVEGVGQFQAAWVISMTYVAFVLTAMSTDYYPKLVENISNSAVVKALVNQQIEIALLVLGPILIFVFSFSSFIVSLLYTNEFVDSSAVLRWQIAGDFLKVFSWPLGFVLLANQRGKVFFLSELIWNLSYCLSAYISLNAFGISGLGLAFFVSYIIYAALIYSVVSLSFDIQLKKYVFVILMILMISILAVVSLEGFSVLMSKSLGLILSISIATYAFYQITNDSYDNKFVNTINNRLSLIFNGSERKR